MPNSRGAPKGNLNALKTGFYSRLFHASEAGDLTSDPPTSLEHEITLLRVMIRRTMELADGIDDLREATRVLDALGAAAGRLSTLMRVQKSLNEGQSGLADEISIAIQQVNAELRNKK
jgi:methyl-accepting chemotaxis protein